ncbi:MAG TPA: hypothetical protein VFP93_01745 [Gammaproteobacteria bacterium]|nr:hypothetical protein [Gammaproteobacteria bacterium]
MRELQMMEVRTISGGLDSLDLGSVMGAWIGYEAGKQLYPYDLMGFNIGGLAAGIGVGMLGAITGRFFAGLLDSYIDPLIDKATGH